MSISDTSEGQKDSIVKEDASEDVRNHELKSGSSMSFLRTALTHAVSPHLEGGLARRRYLTNGH